MQNEQAMDGFELKNFCYASQKARIQFSSLKKRKRKKEETNFLLKELVFFKCRVT